MKPVKKKESNRNKIKRAIWMYEELRTKHSTLYRILKDRYDKVKKGL